MINRLANCPNCGWIGAFEGLDVRCYDPALFAAVKCLAFYCFALISRHLWAKGCCVGQFCSPSGQGLSF